MKNLFWALFVFSTLAHAKETVTDIDNNTCSEVSINASATEVCAGESVNLSVDGLNSSTGVNTQSHSFTSGSYTRIPYTAHLYNLPQSTIEFWYYQESSSEEFIVATEYFNTGWGFHVENNGGSPRFLEWRVSNGVANLGRDIPDRYEIPFNQWIHVAGVHDGSTVYLYIDGNLIDSAPYTGQIGDSYEDIVINRHTWASGSSERLNGKIDELRISNIARYTSNFTPPVYEFNNDSNTLALWHFNGNMQDESQYNTQSVTNGTNFSSNVPFGSYNFNSTDLLWSTGDTTANISVTPTETTEYWLDVTTNGVTCREYVSINVTAPAAPAGDAEQTFCDAATVADLTATGDNIQWYDAATGGNLLDSTTALTDGQMVYASQIVNGCESTDRLEVTVSIQDITITASATEVCAGEEVTLNVNNLITGTAPSCYGSANQIFTDWTELAPNAEYVNIIKHNNIYYLRSNNDVLQSNNINGSWVSMNFQNQIGHQSSPIATLFDFDWADRLHVATLHNSLYAYENGNWINNGLSGYGCSGRALTRLANNRIIVSKWGYLRDLYISDDNGSNWTNVTNVNNDYRDIIVADNGTVFACGGSNTASMTGLIKSTDNGNSFFNISSELGINYASTLSDDCEGNLYVLAENNIYKSTDEGENWTLFSNTPFNSTVTYSFLLPISSDVLFLFGRNANEIGLYESNNGGATWHELTNPLSDLNTIRELKLIDNVLVILSDEGVFGKTIEISTSTFLWSTGDTTANISVTPTETTEYWVDVTTNGLTCREYVIIDVTAPAAPTGDSEQTFCEVSTVADLTATGDNIQWYDAATGGNLLDSITALNDGQMVYASQTIDGCESTDRLEVTVSIQDIQINASSTEVCAGESVDLSVVGDVNSTYLWSTGESNFSGQGTLIDEYSLIANTVSQNTFSTIPGNIYRLEVSGTINLGGGAGNQRDVAYYIQSGSDGTIEGTPFDSACNLRIWTSLFCDTPGLRPSPDIYDASTHTYNYPFTANSSTLDVGFWDSPLSDNGSNVVTFKLYELSNSESTITVTPTETTEYWVDVTTNGVTCREYVTISVNEFPEQPLSGGDISECETITAQSLTAIASAEVGESITWYDAATGGNLVTDPSLSAAGTVTYFAEATNNTSGCSSLTRTAVTLTITSVAAPTGDAVQSFCDNVSVSDLLATGSNIQWYDASTGGNVLDTSSALSDGQLLYASQTQNGCESITRLEVGVEIDIIPDPILITTELEFCLSRETTLADLEVLFDDLFFALEWYDSFSGGNMLPMDTLLEDGVSYYATLYDAVSGCESLMRLEVVPTVIPCEVVIYNAISLNDNGINDYMVIENAEYFPDNILEIYNRDGHLLYSQTQYSIGDNLFRGVANVSGIYASPLSGDGPRLPTGSYLYVFKYFNPYEQQQFTLKGFLTINSN